MTKFRHLLTYISKQNWLLVLTAFLFVFIPLYPKLPLADIIPGYLVRVRLEDFFVLFASLIWVIQFLRKKIVWNTIYFWLIIAYLFTGIASIFSGIFLNHTIPQELLHIGKSGLHLFRYAEYFSLFVIGFAALGSPKQLNLFFKLLLIIVAAITLYGAGQKYLSWPVYSTMNREYSKGQALTLGEHAKVQSTFGGHYDLAAYLVIVLPLLFSYLLSVKNWLVKSLVLTIELGGWWMLVLSGSKTSLLATGLAHAIVFLLYLNEKGFFKKIDYPKIIKISLATLATFATISVAIFAINRDMALTFINLANKIPLIGPVIGRVYKTEQDNSKPQDWIINEPIYEEKKVRLDNGEEAIELVKKELEWSENALKYGISMGIRLDTLWPNAVTALRRNPYVGSSYGNLNKVALEEFTDSDSTDNNFLRTLGETGLIGFVTFYGLIGVLILAFFKIANAERQSTTTLVFSRALLAATIGLGLNALYIDVFAASKVAFIYWLLAGITLKSFYLKNENKAHQSDVDRYHYLKRMFKQHWPLALGLILVGLLTWRNPYLDEFTLLNKFNFGGDDYQNLILARCLVNHDLFSLCRPNASATGLDVNFSPVYAFLLLPIYHLFAHPNAFYFLNFLLFNFTILITYTILRKLFKNHLVVSVLLSLIILNPLIRETTLKSTSTNLVLFLILLVLYLKLKLLPHFKRYYRVFLNHPITLLVLIGGGIFITAGLLKHHQDPWLSNFAIDEKSYAYATIKRANLILNRQLKQQPHLITSLNPYFFDLYGNGHYQVLPASPTQDLYEKASKVWGEFDFDYSKAKTSADLMPLYKKILEQHPLYFTNFEISDFTNLRKQFSFKVADLDCKEKCNLYQLAEKTDPPKLKEPTVYNQLPWASVFKSFETQPNQKLVINIIGHTYPDLNLPENQILPGQAERYYELHYADRLNQIIDRTSDFLILIGNTTTRFEDSRQDYFDRLFTSKYANPIINVPASLEPKKSQEFFQTYTIGLNHFLSLKTLKSDSLTKGELMAFYNLYFDLEFAPTNYLFVLSHEDLRTNQDFMTKVLPLLNQLQNKSIYIVSGNGGVSTQNSNWPDNLGNVSFIQTGFNEKTNPTGLTFTIDPSLGVKVDF